MVMGGMEPVCRARRIWESGAGSTLVSRWRVRRGYMASRSFCPDDLDCRTPRSLPARFRPRSFGDRGLARLYRLRLAAMGAANGGEWCRAAEAPRVSTGGRGYPFTLRSRWSARGRQRRTGESATQVDKGSIPSVRHERHSPSRHAQASRASGRAGQGRRPLPRSGCLDGRGNGRARIDRSRRMGERF